MGHIHSIYDSDLHFAINPITRGITNMSSQKTTLIQYDHNSERFTFEIPRLVEGHDMSTCNVVEVHYLNIDSTTKDRTEGRYIIDDLQISPDDENVVICSWLISQNATRLVGSLNFLVRFVCITGDVPDYVWNTCVFTGISVSNGIYNVETITANESDVIAHWQNRIELLEQGILDNFEDGVTVTAVQEQNNKEKFRFWAGTYEEYLQQIETFPQELLCLITDDTLLEDLKKLRKDLLTLKDELIQLKGELSDMDYNELNNKLTELTDKVTVLTNNMALVKDHINGMKGEHICNLNGEQTQCKDVAILSYNYFVATSEIDKLHYIIFNHVYIDYDANTVHAKAFHDDGITELKLEEVNRKWVATVKRTASNGTSTVYSNYDIYGFRYQLTGV